MHLKVIKKIHPRIFNHKLIIHFKDPNIATIVLENMFKEKLI